MASNVDNRTRPHGARDASNGVLDFPNPEHRRDLVACGGGAASPAQNACAATGVQLERSFRAATTRLICSGVVNYRP